MRFVGSCLLLGVAGSTVLAAPPKEDVAEKFLRERQQEQAIEQQQKSLQQAVKVKQVKAAKDQQCFQIDRINIEESASPRLLDEEVLRDVVGKAQGKCLGKNAVNKLMADITKRYVDKGYITSRAYIPKQDLKTKVLKLVVVQGFVEQVDINTNSSSDRAKLFMAMPLGKGDPLQLRAIEQGIDQLNRVQSAKATMKLWPGKKPGGTRVEVTNKVKNEFRGFMGYDNQGSSSTGKDKFRLGLEADNVLSLNDTWAAYLISSLDTNALAVSASIPYENWAFSLSHSHSEFLSPLTATSELFGDSVTNTLGIDTLLFRDGEVKTYFNASITHRQSKRFINDVKLTPQRFTSARVGISWTTKNKQGLWLRSFGYTRGLELWDATKDVRDIGGGFPHAQFDKIDLSITRITQLADIEYRGTLRAQHAGQSLYGSDQIHLGDLGTVRGYRETPASGDSGIYLRNDFNMRFGQEVSAIAQEQLGLGLKKLKPYLFLDLGYNYARADERKNRLAGAGFGLKYPGKQVSFDVSFAVPLKAEPASLEDKPYEFYASFTINVF